jgi:two-component system cell cycle sensor histidine kinase/response regulator CckA
MTRKNQQTEATALKKYPTGISGFKENTGDGLPEGKPALVCGCTSRGKILFATVCIVLMLFYTAKAYSQLSAAVQGYDLTNHPLLFLGNETLPPMTYLKNDKQVGIVVDLAEALKKRMTRPVRFKYMNWTQAQQLVLEGGADALLQINPTEERKKIYDFSDSLLESEFSIFISFGREGVYDIAGLRGLRVGVEEKGLPINILKQDPLIKSVVIPDVISGFHLLADGAVDAVVVDRWVGSFVLAENNIRGIRIAGEAIDKSDSAIAVRKGNTELLSEINKALAEIKEDGTYTEILAKWQSKEVVFQTKDQHLKQKIILATTLCVLIITIVWGIFLLNEIKKRKKTEKALRESEERFRNVYETAPLAFVVWDKNTRVTDWNKKAEEIFGWTKEEVVGHNFFDFLIPEKDRPHVEDVVDSLLKGDLLSHSINENLTKEGKIITCEWNNSALHDDDGNIIGAISLGLDITDRKQTEEERQILEAQLQQAQKMEAIATLAGGVAHEFNNALYTITGNIELLDEDYLEDKGIRNYTDPMKASTQRMTRLSNQLLAYARGGKYQPKIISSNDLVEDLLPVIKHIIPSVIGVETDLPQSVFNIEVDLTQMQMVLSAIVKNSVEAIKDKGRLRIIVINEDLDEEFVKHHAGLKPGPHICFTVEDNGKGMDKKTRERIFEPFFTTKFQGRGLGMAAAYGIVKNHNGWISVYSELGEGTVVRIYLPAIEVQIEKAKESKPELIKGIGTILLIEDEELVMDVSLAMLERLGYSVLAARTGIEGIDIAKVFDGDIDLAILDIGLPDMRGDKVYTHLMKNRPNLKVLVCSGYSIDGPAQEMMDGGAQGFIQKPFSLERLSVKLKEVLKDR